MNTPWTEQQMLPCGDRLGEVTPTDVQRAMDAVGRARHELRTLSTEQIVDRLGRVHHHLLESPDSPLPALAAAVEQTTGMSQPMVLWSVRNLLRQLTPRAMMALVEAEFGHGDPFQGPRMLATHACARAANPPDSVFYVLAGTVPSVAIEAIVLGLLCRAPMLLKTARVEPVTARVYLTALRKLAPDLARAVAVLTWEGGNTELERVACDRAGVVVAYGNNATIDAMYQRCRFPTKFVGYGHRVSLGIMDAVEGKQGEPVLQELAQAWATDASAYDQFGCMSLSCLFVSTRLPWTLREVGEAIARQGFPWVETWMPRGRLEPGVLAAQMQMRGVAEFTAELIESPAGSVIVHDQCRFEPTPGGRLLHLVPWDETAELEAALQPLRGHLSTAGVWCSDARRIEITAMLGRAGVRRICRPGRMQRPLWLRDHDGRPRISDWVDWTNVEPSF